MKALLKTVFVLCFVFLGITGISQETSLSVHDLTPWVGNSVSMELIFDLPEAQPLMEAVVQYKSGYTPESVRAAMKKQYEGNLKRFEVLTDGQTIIVNGNIKLTYTYFGSLNTKWGEYDISWFIFLSDTPEAKKLGMSTLLLMPYHSDGPTSPSHCHLRYSAESFAYLTTTPTLENWWPTFYHPEELDTVTFINQMKSKAKMLATMLPDIK